MSMECPLCAGATKCYDSREVEPNLVIRKYKCRVCHNRFKTEERVSMTIVPKPPVPVVDGRHALPPGKAGQGLQAYLLHGRAGEPMQTVEVQVRQDLADREFDDTYRTHYWVLGRAIDGGARWQRVRYTTGGGGLYIRLYEEGKLRRTRCVIYYDNGELVKPPKQRQAMVKN